MHQLPLRVRLLVVQVFGVIGLVIGPLVLSLLMSIIDIYKQVMRGHAAPARPMTPNACTTRSQTCGCASGGLKRRRNSTPLQANLLAGGWVEAPEDANGGLFLSA